MDLHDQTTEALSAPIIPTGAAPATAAPLAIDPEAARIAELETAVAAARVALDNARRAAWTAAVEADRALQARPAHYRAPKGEPCPFQNADARAESASCSAEEAERAFTFAAHDLEDKRATTAILRSDIGKQLADVVGRHDRAAAALRKAEAEQASLQAALKAAREQMIVDLVAAGGVEDPASVAAAADLQTRTIVASEAAARLSEAHARLKDLANKVEKRAEWECRNLYEEIRDARIAARRARPNDAGRIYAEIVTELWGSLYVQQPNGKTVSRMPDGVQEWSALNTSTVAFILRERPGCMIDRTTVDPEHLGTFQRLVKDWLSDIRQRQQREDELAKRPGGYVGVAPGFQKMVRPW